MWVPKEVADWFKISKDHVDDLRAELAIAKSERDTLRNQLAVTQTNFDWLRMKVNSLELERGQLLEKAYGVHIPVPELVRQPVTDPTFDPRQFSFEDIGDEMAKKLGLPAYDSKD